MIQFFEIVAFFRPGFNWISSETHLVGEEPFHLILFCGHCVALYLSSYSFLSELQRVRGQSSPGGCQPRQEKYVLCSMFIVSLIFPLIIAKSSPAGWEVVNPDRGRQEVKGQSDQRDNCPRYLMHNLIWEAIGSWGTQSIVLSWEIVHSSRSNQEDN